MGIVTLPNAITFFRLLLVIPFVVFLSKGHPLYAAMLFAIIAILDGVDGFIARSTRQQSRFGEVLDSFSDVTILIVSFLSSGYYGYIQKEWHLLLTLSAAFLVFSKLLHAHLSKETVSTLPGKTTAVLAYATILATLLSLPLSSLAVGVFVASSLYTSVTFLHKSFKKS